jgi:hypothetical protein
MRLPVSSYHLPYCLHHSSGLRNFRDQQNRFFSLNNSFTDLLTRIVLNAYFHVLLNCNEYFTINLVLYHTIHRHIRVNG